jgi:hypothetical protein
MGKTSAFTALVIPKRRGVGFYAGQTLNTKCSQAIYCSATSDRKR